MADADDVDMRNEGYVDDSGDEQDVFPVDNDDLDNDIDIMAAEDIDTQRHAMPNTERVTSPYMTKYEKARIIGTRALQISMNAPVTVELGGLTDPILIAEKELYELQLPFIIRRYLPNGAFEDWPLAELIIERT
eukprot:GHVR01085028.1.p1 GENE.GHVR01085028.1~~GHVR01085028.1.p1  ORF type:complete len:134 (+),score=33.80 GHVR01085028.1:48-449(+)